MSHTGVIFNSLVKNCLAEIPADSKYHLNTSLGLSKWLESGAYYKVDCPSGRQFTITGSTSDFIESNFSELEKLLAHLVEQSVAIQEELKSDDHSPAWLLVSTYYQFYFAASCLSRLALQPIVWLTAERSEKLSQHSGSTKNPGAGTYSSFFSTDRNAPNSATYILKKSQSGQLHDKLCRWLHSQYHSLKNTPDAKENEIEFFKALFDLPWKNDETWPSELRNLVNYNPGFAYLETVENPEIKNILAVIKGIDHSSVNALISTISTYAPRNRHIKFEDKKSDAFIVLYCRAQLLTSLVLALHNTIINSREFSNNRQSEINTYVSKKKLKIASLE